MYEIGYVIGWIGAVCYVAFILGLFFFIGLAVYKYIISEIYHHRKKLIEEIMTISKHKEK